MPILSAYSAYIHQFAYIQYFTHNQFIITNMTTSELGIVPLFSENAKFNRINWLTWKEAIMMVIDSKEAEGYLDGSIVCPVPASKIPTITVTKALGVTSTTASPTPLPTIITIFETYWDSLTLSIRE